MSGPIHQLTAVEIAAGIRARRFSAVEVLADHLARIEAVDPLVNAIVTLDADAALEAARAADRALARGGRGQLGPLLGLPIAVKDLVDTAGLRTTYGSPLFRDHVPQRDALLVQRLRAAGAIVVGKTNTSEFGAGSQTCNAVFGPTRNPFDRARTPGGSSGGAAAAVAARLVPLADGSDLAASVRNPASFCNLVGIRPTPGTIPEDSDAADPWSPFGVSGTFGRTVADAALLLRALAGREAGAPLSALQPLPGDLELRLREPGDGVGVRVAWSRDLGGLPVEPEVLAALEPAREALAAIGCDVRDAEPALAFADEAFDTLRAVMFAAAHGAKVDATPEQVKQTIHWNVARGRALDGAAVARAITLRGRAFHTLREFLQRFDVLALPTSQVVPFPVEVEWPRQVAGAPMEHYVAWLRSCSRITVTGHPAISLPAGFTPSGLPVGLQLVGRHGGDAELLRVAATLERALAERTAREPILYA
ncbi:amidase family protein [Conexibacter sp. CPCC 206217]|uniref:amidase family protein n=1 Tax=Conexibacter sp. CPCC 206217 TaxID=3064574 RepID=UPI00271FC8D8|nr:amidase family protein [Conexibacter sp. CPCC 206217]MDO8212096.1 amidase family protein [Conexibacter sp. CPCC 206217]